MVPAHQIVPYISSPNDTDAINWFLGKNLGASIYHLFSSSKLAKTWFLRKKRRFLATFI